MRYPPSWIVAYGGSVIVLPAFFGARLTLRNENPGKICIPDTEQVAIHAVEHADKMKMHILCVRPRFTRPDWLSGLFPKKYGSTITLLHERQQNGGKSRFLILFPWCVGI